MENIKLLALDIDGTLVNDQKQLSPLTNAVFNALIHQGITLVFCSGRQIHSLLNQFKDYQHQAIYIGENGGISHYDDQLHIHAKLNSNQIHTVLDRLATNPKITPVLSGLDTAYIPAYCTDKFIEEIQPYYPFHTVKTTHNIDGVVMKVAAHVDQDSYHEIYLPNQDLQDSMDVCVSADQWCDFNPKGSSKGATLALIMKQLHIAPHQAMAIGDSGNDISMLNSVEYSVAMKNAIDSVKSIAKYITKYDNNDFGCIHFLIDYFKLNIPYSLQ